MKKRFLLLVLNFLIITSLNAAIVPGTQFSGIIEKLDKKNKFVIIKNIKFYFYPEKQKILEKYLKTKIKIIFSYIEKNGKKYIIYIKENPKILY